MGILLFMDAITNTIKQITGKPVVMEYQSSDLTKMVFNRNKYTPAHVVAITDALNAKGIRTVVTRRKENGRVSSTLVVEII